MKSIISSIQEEETTLKKKKEREFEDIHRERTSSMFIFMTVSTLHCIISSKRWIGTDPSLSAVNDGCGIKSFPNLHDPHEDQAGCSFAQKAGGRDLLNCCSCFSLYRKERATSLSFPLHHVQDVQR